jgi:hypothetical protein
LVRGVTTKAVNRVLVGGDTNQEKKAIKRNWFVGTRTKAVGNQGKK